MGLISDPAFEKILAAFSLKDPYEPTALGKGHINDTYLLTSIKEQEREMESCIKE